MESIHMKYESLLEVTKNRCAEITEQCRRLEAERDCLREDLQASKEENLILQSDLTRTRMASPDAQLNLAAYLEESLQGSNNKADDDLEALRQKAEKYPKLKAAAISLKERLDKQCSLLRDSKKENSRLKMIVSDHERKVRELVNELEGLRKQILAKNEVISKLEVFIRHSANE